MIQRIFMKYKIYWNHQYILRYKIHQYLLMGVEMSSHHHHTTHRKKEWHIEEILIHTAIHPIRYRTHHITRIQTQVCQILLRQSHLIHQMTSIINKDDMKKGTKINSGVKWVSMNQSKIARNLQPSYLQPRTNQRSLDWNWTKSHYSTGFISYPSWIHLKLYYQNFQRHTCYLWNINL